MDQLDSPLTLPIWFSLKSQSKQILRRQIYIAADDINILCTSLNVQFTCVLMWNSWQQIRSQKNCKCSWQQIRSQKICKYI